MHQCFKGDGENQGSVHSVAKLQESTTEYKMSDLGESSSSRKPSNIANLKSLSAQQTITHQYSRLNPSKDGSERSAAGSGPYE